MACNPKKIWGVRAGSLAAHMQYHNIGVSGATSLGTPVWGGAEAPLSHPLPTQDYQEGLQVQQRIPAPLRAAQSLSFCWSFKWDSDSLVQVSSQPKQNKGKKRRGVGVGWRGNLANKLFICPQSLTELVAIKNRGKLRKGDLIVPKALK